MVGPALTNFERSWRGLVICFGGGLLFLYFTLRGIVPDSRVVWGKSKAGQKMSIGQRILFFIGALIFFAFGVLQLFIGQ
jgi:hypothetical protein